MDSGRIVQFAKRLYLWLNENYFAQRTRARRAIEQDARRWGGQVTWHD